MGKLIRKQGRHNDLAASLLVFVTGMPLGIFLLYLTTVAVKFLSVLLK
ncbi:MAG TPA: hypothetical protein VHC47_13175 [Mucilaginibacter sp.]|nr:hypothetical protein [Mucilaginibacter sp.]